MDARKKDELRLVYTVDVAVLGNEARLLQRYAGNPKIAAAKEYTYSIPKPRSVPDSRPVVVGFGPGGMFAALVLAEAGLCPIVLERGQDAASRKRAVESFWATGRLDPACNVQFGEGGAGTFFRWKAEHRHQK